jgi:hypothetical protein
MPYQPPQIPNFGRVARAFREIAYPQACDRVAKFAEEQRKTFVEHIERQYFVDFLLHPLSPAYKARKIKAGADPRVMIATKTYIGAIRVFRKALPKAQATQFKIGFHPRRHARDMHGNLTHTPLWKVAMWHEFGSRNRKLPARRHWRPFLRNDLRKAARAFRPQVAKAITRAVRARMKRGG